MRKPFTHIICWLIFIIYEVTIALYLGSKAPLWEFACFYMLNIALFYFNAHIIFERILKGKELTQRMVVLVVLVLGELIIYTISSICLNFFCKKIQGVETLALVTIDSIVEAIWRGIYFLGLSAGYWFALRAIRVSRLAQQGRIQQLEMAHEKVRLEKNNINLQNAYLHAQINPHFLFNTLNFIYNKVKTTSPEGADTIMLLSEIMRYSLCGIEEDGKVPLNQEIEQIRRYIELIGDRFDHNLSLDVEIEDVFREMDKRIPPLLLFTFIENIFKHGNVTDTANPGVIQIGYSNGWLTLHTKNRKKSLPAYTVQYIGIKNAQTRLENYYRKEEVNLSIQDLEDNFILNLKIRL